MYILHSYPIFDNRLWFSFQIGLFAKIDLHNVPGLMRLLREGEELEDLQKLTPEEILIRWVNYHMENAGGSMMRRWWLSYDDDDEDDDGDDGDDDNIDMMMMDDGGDDDDDDDDGDDDADMEMMQIMIWRWWLWWWWWIIRIAQFELSFELWYFGPLCVRKITSRCAIQMMVRTIIWNAQF